MDVYYKGILMTTSILLVIGIILILVVINSNHERKKVFSNKMDELLRRFDDNQNNNYLIRESSMEESKQLVDNLIEYNLSKVPLIQDSPNIWINKVAEDINGNMIGGINSRMYCWNCLYVDILWVKEEYRNKHLGSKLLKEVEAMAKEKGCSLIHLDTFDFQAKDFYLKHGYEIFGVLDNCPENHKRYYLKKDLK